MRSAFSLVGCGAESPCPVRSAPSCRVETQIVITDRQLFELQDIYGIEEPRELECVVCASEPKDIVPLPCRHCCMCHSCFDALPVCWQGVPRRCVVTHCPPRRQSTARSAARK